MIEELMSTLAKLLGLVGDLGACVLVLVLLLMGAYGLGKLVCGAKKK
jgi:hypothetical protein